MRTPLRTLLALLLAVALLGAPAPAPAHAQDTSAVAINTKDGADLFKLAFAIRSTMKDVVDVTNMAVAYSSCDVCSTVAISFQVVLAGGGPSTVVPQNVAIALNENCTTCLTAAFAYQFIVAGNEPMRLTKDGEKRLKALRKHLRDLESQPLTIDQLAAELNRAAQEVRDVLATELVPARREDQAGDEQGQDGQDDRAPPDAPSAASSPTPAPSAPPGSSPTPEATATPTVSPTATATPSETPASTPTATPTATP